MIFLTRISRNSRNFQIKMALWKNWKFIVLLAFVAGTFFVEAEVKCNPLPEEYKVEKAQRSAGSDIVEIMCKKSGYAFKDGSKSKFVQCWKNDYEYYGISTLATPQWLTGPETIADNTGVNECVQAKCSDTSRSFYLGRFAPIFLRYFNSAGVSKPQTITKSAVPPALCGDHATYPKPLNKETFTSATLSCDKGQFQLTVNGEKIPETVKVGNKMKDNVFSCRVPDGCSEWFDGCSTCSYGHQKNGICPKGRMTRNRLECKDPSTPKCTKFVACDMSLTNLKWHVGNKLNPKVFLIECAKFDEDVKTGKYNDVRVQVAKVTCENSFWRASTKYGTKYRPTMGHFCQNIHVACDKSLTNLEGRVGSKRNPNVFLIKCITGRAFDVDLKIGKYGRVKVTCENSFWRASTKSVPKYRKTMGHFCQKTHADN